jgi:hypothetical protein
VYGEKGASVEGAEALGEVSSKVNGGFVVGIVGPGAGPCGTAF